MKKSFLKYFGGKSLFANKIIPLIPSHQCYCEVFCGAAWLLFKKDESKVEIINDINQDLVTLYRVVKNHLEEFIRCFKWMLMSRDEFDLLKKENPDALTDIQRAVRFYYLLKNGYGGKVDNPYFSTSHQRPPALNLLSLEEDLSNACLRLSRVYIENKGYKDLMNRYDDAGTFFYCDPPYFNRENCYGKNIFSKEDFITLKNIYKTLKGKFIMSINDTPEIREYYQDFNIKEVKATYSVSGKVQKVTELLIMNF